MAIKAYRNAKRSVEMLKLCRSQWLTAREVSGHLGLVEHAVLLTLRECEAEGFMVSRLRERTPSQRGHSPFEFRVSDAWRNGG